MKFRLLSFFIALILSTGAMAQFNDTVFYQFRYSATGIINKTTEATSYVTNNDARFNISKKRTSFSSMVKHVYGEQEKKTNNDFTALADYEFCRNTNRFFLFASNTYDKSFSLGIKHRLQSGGGVGWNVVKSEKLNVLLTEGMQYEYIDLYETQSNNLPRNNVRVKYRLTLNSRLSMEGQALYQQSLEDNHDYILRTNNILNLKLNKWLNLYAGTEYNKLNITSKENLLSTFGVSVDRYF